MNDTIQCPKCGAYMMYEGQGIWHCLCGKMIFEEEKEKKYCKICGREIPYKTTKKLYCYRCKMLMLKERNHEKYKNNRY